MIVFYFRLLPTVRSVLQMLFSDRKASTLCHYFYNCICLFLMFSFIELDLTRSVKPVWYTNAGFLHSNRTRSFSTYSDFFTILVKINDFNPFRLVLLLRPPSNFSFASIIPTTVLWYLGSVSFFRNLFFSLPDSGTMFMADA